MGRQALALSQPARTRASAHTFMDRLELDLAARKQRLAVLLPPPAAVHAWVSQGVDKRKTTGVLRASRQAGTCSWPKAACEARPRPAHNRQHRCPRLQCMHTKADSKALTNLGLHADTPRLGHSHGQMCDHRTDAVCNHACTPYKLPPAR
jgi:hypothetical protein